MMKVTCSSQDALNNAFDGVVLFSYEEGSDTEEKLKTKLGPTVALSRERKEFEGKPKQIFLERQAGTPRFFVMVGLGKKQNVTVDTLRVGAAIGAEQLRNAGAKDIAIALPQELDREALGQAIVEGALLRTYQFNKYKTQRLSDIKVLSSITLLAERDLAAVARGAEIGAVIADSCNLSRDLQNTPSSDMTPKDVAGAALKLSREEKLKCDIMDYKKLHKQGWGGLVGVGRGSMNTPCLVTLEYAPRGAKTTIALVGKGLCFDSGGISIKPSDKMGEMKFDMSGAASVLGIMRNASRLKLPVRVIGILCLAENMPSGSSYKPGDVVKTKSGKTIEIDNTDAEGRVVLADGLYHAGTFKPDAIIDMATLTGAIVVALGDVAAGALGNNQALVDKLNAASAASGEKIWQLPLWDDYSEDIKSQIADMKNVGMGRMAGAMSGATLLKEFVGDTPWVHLDIAGVAWAQGRERYYTPYGGTAFGVRLVTQYLRDV